MTARLVVLASGNGSNLQALLDASQSGELDATIVAVISNNADASALTRAISSGAAAVIVAAEPGEPRTAFDARLADACAEFSPDYVVLAGWMRLLSMAFLSNFPQRVVNLHPALPGEFPGTHAIKRALQAHQRLGLGRTGAMVHFVPDEGVDNGPVIATVEVPIEPDDTVESLEQRVHTAEHALLVKAIQQLVTSPRDA